MPNNYLTRTSRKIGAYFKRQKPFRTPQNILRADGRMISKGIISLFNPNMSNQKVSRMATRDAKKIYLQEEGTFMARLVQADANYHPVTGEINIINKKNGETTFHEKIILLSHELSHKRTTFRGHNLAANAIGRYMGLMFPEKRNQKEWWKFWKFSNNFYPWPNNMLDSSKLFGPRGAEISKVLDKKQNISRSIISTIFSGFFSSIEHGNKQRLQIRDKDYLGDLGGQSIASVGEQIADFATAIEFKRKKPGLGLFVIRETTIGIPFSRAMENALTGVYDAELEIWKQKNPELTKYLLGTHAPDYIA